MSPHDPEGHVCIDVAALGEVWERPADDPLRREVEACPRCAARLAAYRVFLSEAEVAGARTADARARLDAFRAARIEAPAMRKSLASPWRRLGDGWRRLGEFRALRPALVAAAAVLVAAVVWWQSSEPPAPVLRGGGHDVEFVIDSAQIVGGVLEVSWPAFAGADAYEVRLFTNDLAAVATFGPVAETHLSAPVDGIRARAPGQRTFLCSVAALNSGDEIAVSAPEPVALP